MPYRVNPPKYSEADRVYTEALTWPEMATLRRIRLGWTKDDLASKSGMTRMTLWRVEMGLVRPNPATQKVIELALEQGERELAEELGAVSTDSQVPV